MEKRSLLILIYLFSVSIICAQIQPAQFQPFIDHYILINQSGNGLEETSGDILLELGTEEQVENEKLVILRNQQGKLSKIAENTNLLMGKEDLGVSGSNDASIIDSTLFIDYTLGSNSSQSDISIVFTKGSNSQYYFKEYTSKTKNYGVENLYKRLKITAEQTGMINFSQASENLIFEKANIKSTADDEGEPIYKAATKFAKYIPEDWRLAIFAEGDLNLDAYKKDIILVLYDEPTCRIQLLLQQKDGSYQSSDSNQEIILSNENFNLNNLRVVIKNGYFTIEQRVSISDDDFDHQYITFKYNADQKNWFLHRFDVEHYSGFNPKPSTNVTHFTKKEFGNISFKNLETLPGIYYYEPESSIINGTLIIKQFYGLPNFGETPEKDEKVQVYILKTDYPINIIASIDQEDTETSDKSISNISEIQIYSTDKNLDLKNLVEKKVALEGIFQKAQSGYHYTKVIFEVKKVIP